MHVAPFIKIIHRSSCKKLKIDWLTDATFWCDFLYIKPFIMLIISPESTVCGKCIQRSMCLCLASQILNVSSLLLNCFAETLNIVYLFFVATPIRLSMKIICWWHLTITRNPVVLYSLRKVALSWWLHPRISRFRWSTWMTAQLKWPSGKHTSEQNLF